MYSKYDKDFLLQLDKRNLKTKYARITLLTQKETPIKSIEGTITQGSLNIDGNSAVRRSCSLTMVSNDSIPQVYNWTKNNKFKLEIGLKNDINPKYPSIIWFPQGIYVFTSCSCSHSSSNFTISLQGKDKGCLINGEVSGKLTSSAKFDIIEEENGSGQMIKRKLSLKEIILNLMHSWGHEPYQNIDVRDLDGYGLELLEYGYEEPVYLYRSAQEDVYKNIFLESLAPTFTDINGQKLDLSKLGSEYFDPLSNLHNLPEANSVYLEGNEYKLLKIQYGDVAGYKKVPLIYGDTLAAAVGDSITSILDKIKNMLGEYEYFYNIQGRFVFQKKQSFINTLLSSGTDAIISETYSFEKNQLINSLNSNLNINAIKNDFSIHGQRKSVTGETVSFIFRYGLQQKPVQYTSITVGDNDKELKDYNETYGLTIKGQESELYNSASHDWREIIYQMAKDKNKYGFLSDFEVRLAEKNPGLYDFGSTGYEQYYVDLLSFWRDLYFPQIVLEKNIARIERIYTNIENCKATIKAIQEKIEERDAAIKALENRNEELASIFHSLPLFENVSIENFQVSQKASVFSLRATSSSGTLAAPEVRIVRREDLPKPSTLGSPPIVSFVVIEDVKEKLAAPFVEIKILMSQEEAKLEYDNNKGEIERLKNTVFEFVFIDGTPGKANLDIALEVWYSSLQDENRKLAEYNKEFLNKDYRDYIQDAKSDFFGWHKNVIDNEDQLNFWFDLLDSNGEAKQYNVENLGQRSKIINDKEIKAISFRQTPEIIFIDGTETPTSGDGFRYIQIGDRDNFFYKSTQGRSAQDKIDELLFESVYSNNQVTFNAIPIYYLEPNTRIYLSDAKSNIEGDYIISRLSLPLAYSGTMSVTAIKAVENLI